MVDALGLPRVCFEEGGVLILLPTRVCCACIINIRNYSFRIEDIAKNYLEGGRVMLADVTTEIESSGF